ncbi:MAG: FMN-binding protein [Bacteroidota bacterium]
MKLSKLALIFGVVLSGFVFSAAEIYQPDLPKVLKEKMQKTIIGIFELAPENYQLNLLNETDNNFSEDEFLFEIRHSKDLIGFAFLGKANSMKDVFDYLIIFDDEFRILKSKVLIYRETHGRQIGSQRWLKQFYQLKPGDQPSIGKDVQAISGATISSKSMTKAVADILSKLEDLQSKNYFDETK